MSETSSSKPTLSTLRKFYEDKKAAVSQAIEPLKQGASKAVETVKQGVDKAIEIGKGYGEGLKTLYVDIPREIYNTLTEEEKKEKTNGK